MIDKQVKNKDVKGKEIVVDTSSGSMSYNRLEMQVSQTLHMAIEIFDSLDYLFVLDYYDDITMFDKETNPETVSYFQVKTNEASIRINTAITENWLVKMYTQLENTEWLVKELGLITNCPLVISVKTKNNSGNNKTKQDVFTSEKTSFMKFNLVTINKIKEDIAKKKGIDINSVDLSKFFHIRTTLSIPKHREIVEQEMGAFLYNKYPRITMDSVKTIFCTMIDLLTRRQRYELLDVSASFPEVRNKKGVSKREFEEVIEAAMLISIPPFEEIERALSCQGDDKYRASYAYTLILADSQTKSDTFTSLFEKVRDMIKENNREAGKSLKEYSVELSKKLYSVHPDFELLYNETYISVLIASIVISEMRRS